jgi:uncharacterized membrane protein YadS
MKILGRPSLPGASGESAKDLLKSLNDETVAPRHVWIAFNTLMAFILSAMSVVTPARLPLSTSVFVTHAKSVCGTQPIFSATDTIAAQRDR